MKAKGFVQELIELYILKKLTEIDELAETLVFDDSTPIASAASGVKNQPIILKMFRKKFVLDILKGL